MDIRRALRARSHRREGRIDDMTVPQWTVAFAAVGSVSTYRCGKDVAAPGNPSDVLIIHAILGVRDQNSFGDTNERKTGGRIHDMLI